MNMTDDQNNGFVSTGFGFGDTSSGGTAPTPPPAQTQPQASQPTPPAQTQPQASQPTPPPPPPAQAAPMAGFMGDDDFGAAEPKGDPNYRFGERMKNFTTTIKLPAHSLKFDEDKFLNLLAGSISLSRDEKKKIIDSIPKLRQDQVDELMRIFEEEREKFIELSPKHSTQLKKLEDQHAADWKDLEVLYKANVKQEEDQNKAEEIRKQLGLN